MSNPFVKIVCGNLNPQSTEVVTETLTPSWNQTFTFQGLMFNDTELQTSELRFEVYSKNRFFGNALIGSFSINLSTLYKNANHEYFNAWLVLQNPDEDPDDPQGFLLVNCFIIGPGDRPPVHDANDKVNQDVADEDEEVNIDAMNFEQLRAYQEKKQGIIVLGKPLVARKSFQLSVYVFKCENLPNFGDSLVSSGKPTAFISARAVGLVQKTKRVGNNNSPLFNQKMLFPCYFPFLNDKIIMRIWNYQSRGTDEFIANIPEFPMQNDFFNISKLISIGGRMPAKWINLYGIPPLERNSGMGRKKKHPRQGTSFLGRILMSFSLLANEKPKCSTLPCNPFYEPDTQAYRLFCDIYEVKYLKEEMYDILVWCDCRIGPYTTGDNKRRRPNKGRAVWERTDKANHIVLPEILEHFPKDITQIPDIFLNLYTGGEGKGERIGYIRLDPEEVLKWDSIPRWLHFNPLDMNQDSPGSILCNLQFMIDNENTKRIFREKGISKQYTLHSLIVQGFELDPKNGDDDIETVVDVAFDTKSVSTGRRKGRYPFWNEYNKLSVEVDWKLNFAPDVVITCHKLVKKGIFSKDKEEREEIGRFTVPIRCIRKDGKKYPHYFNLIKSNEISGRIMAMFYIEPQKKNDKVNSIAFPIHNDLKIETKADIKLFVLGIRNLDFEPDFNKVEFEAVLCKTNDEIESPGYSESKKEMEKVNDISERENFINLLQVITFPNVTIHGKNDFQIFPWVKLILRQKNIFSTDERYLFFNLSEYSTASENTKKIQRILFEQNLGVLTLDQEQKFIDDIEKVREKKAGSNDDDSSSESEEEIQFKVDKQEKEPIQKDKVAVFDENADRKLVKQMTKYKNMLVSDEIVLTCMHKDKMKEKEVRKALRKKYGKEIKQLRRQDLQTTEDKERLVDLQDQIRELKKPLMNEQMFYSFDDIADDFDYGREVYKEDIYESHPNMVIPYKRQNLMFIPRGLFVDRYEAMQGYYKLGKESPAFIKFNVEIKIKNEEGKYLSDGVTELGERAQKYLDKKKRIISADDADYELENEVLNEMNKYNIFNEIYLKKLRNLYLNKREKMSLPNLKKEIVVKMENVKVRVYIYRCLNLTAQENHGAVIDWLAGYDAFSKANAYLEIQLGDNHSESSDNRGLKYICDKQSFVPNSLSPDFFKYYELDADLPHDWKLTINVMSHTDGGVVDSLIGSTVIDIEDRHLGEYRTRNLLKYKAMETYYENLLRELENKENEDNSELIKMINKKLNAINTKSDDLKPSAVPVEFRPLYKPGTKTAQGIIEMFVEVFPQNIAKIIKPAKIEQPPPEEYELRLVIWETRDIPLGKKVKINIVESNFILLINHPIYF